MTPSTTNEPRASRRTAGARSNGAAALESMSARLGGNITSRQEFQALFDSIVDNVGHVIKGKDEVVRMLLVAMLAEGHVLIEDMPGTGKTMLARAVAQSVNARVNRIQCTPDLLPGDITGTNVYDQRKNSFEFREGPVFANILLVDEVNRATPKTQSALLEAMQERRVSADNHTYDLPHPFLVLATQNPVELAGTFQLPEAQLDRFLLKLSVGYAEREEELSVLLANLHGEAIDHLESVIDLDRVIDMVAWAKGVNISHAVLYYIIDICAATRKDPALTAGASSRASQALMRASRVVAASQGREDVIPDDIRPLVKPVLAHRLMLSPDAVLRGETVDNVIDRILAQVKVSANVADERIAVAEAAGV